MISVEFNGLDAVFIASLACMPQFSRQTYVQNELNLGINADYNHNLWAVVVLATFLATVGATAEAV